VEKFRVLLVEDVVALALTYEAYLSDLPYEVRSVDTGKAAMLALVEDVPDVVLLDLMLPDMDGLSILEHISTQHLPVAVIVITANASLSVAIEAMRLGALDFLIKPFSAARLKVTLNNALERQHLTRIVDTYRHEIDRHEYQGFIGSSLAMQGVYRTIDAGAKSKATIFITGESGTGKEICAEAIHKQSSQAKGRFVALNCGAIPQDLMESEIFGHVKGAFTGAVADREGAARRAHGGTLFLDEICEMDISLQIKLLRFIQTNAFQKVGGNQLETVDIRFVCATNKDPLTEVGEGRFREDLYYRLHVIPILMPPLKDRDGDVLAIAEHLLAVYAQEEAKDFQAFDDDVRAVFIAYPWPGNVRQLQNVVRNIVVLNDGPLVSSAMLPAPLDQLVGTVEPLPSMCENVSHMSSVGPARDLENPLWPQRPEDLHSLEDVERDFIERAIWLCDDNVSKAAAYLGISSSTIYRKRQNWVQ